MSTSKTRTVAQRVTIAVDAIATRFQFVRGHKIILDSDLVTLYGVETRRLNEQVRRNLDRFPSDFMFQLTEKEVEF